MPSPVQLRTKHMFKPFGWGGVRVKACAHSLADISEQSVSSPFVCMQKAN